MHDGRDDVLRPEGLAQPGEVVGLPLRKPPSSSMRFIASCEPVSMTRITRTWLVPILRVRPACSRRYLIASVRSATSSGNSTSSSLRLVRSGEALVGIFVRAMWAVMATSLPGALSRCRTAYPMVRSLFRRVVWLKKGPLWRSACAARQGCPEGLTLWPIGAFFSVGGPMRRKSPNKLWLFPRGKSRGREAADGWATVPVSFRATLQLAAATTRRAETFADDRAIRSDPCGYGSPPHGR